jgi:anti-anti-sigma regulatory factor
VDAGKLAFVGALGMQVLISANRQWAEDGHAFSIHPTTPALASAARGLGVDLAAIGAEPDQISTPERTL